MATARAGRAQQVAPRWVSWLFVGIRSVVTRRWVVVDVVVLGSGTPNPTPTRAGAAVAVVDGSPWVLVDCGRGATQRALEAGLDLTTVLAVMLTHHHSDHLSDLATLATTRWSAGADPPLTVVAPDGPASRYAGACLSIFEDECFHGQARRAAGRRPTINVAPFPGPHELTTVVDRLGWIVSTALVDHHPITPAVGYRIERNGIVVTVSGDTAVCDAMDQLARDADVLVHEALLTASVTAELLEWNAGARQVGQLAARSQVGQLVLTHLMPAPGTLAENDAFVVEARTGGYTGSIHVAHDLLTIAADR